MSWQIPYIQPHLLHSPIPYALAPHHILTMVLSFILIQNRQGKTRLAKYYNAYSDDEKIKLKGEVNSLHHPRLLTTPLFPPVHLSLAFLPSTCSLYPPFASCLQPALTLSKGPPPRCPSRPKIPIQLRRVS
jgi:hypothetical protein